MKKYREFTKDQLQIKVPELISKPSLAESGLTEFINRQNEINAEINRLQSLIMKHQNRIKTLKTQRQSLNKKITDIRKKKND